MPRLYTYCIPFDDGAAPNPFWELCTLNICKPAIRRTAKKGDWVVATGSKRFGFEGKVVYAMEVTEIMTMQEYQTYCKTQLQEKIPNWESSLYIERVGDCIYDFTSTPPTVAASVHDQRHMARDLGGKKTLLSNHFYYFGEEPRELPESLLKIVNQRQAHRSTANQPYFDEFVEWILDQQDARNKVLSLPKSRNEIMEGFTSANYCLTADIHAKD